MTHRGTILVVDDTAESLTLVFRLLTQAGYLVRPADSGELALAAVATTSPELILLDIRMPGMDGFEVCRQLKASEASRDIPVLFLSAVSETAERVEGLRLGAVDFITKPFQAEEVSARVSTHLEICWQKRELKRLNSEKDKFFSIIAHDLRSPLAGLMTLAEIMADESKSFSPDLKKEMMQDLSNTARNTYNLLTNLLEWSRMQRGYIEYNPQIIELKDLIAENFSIATDLASNKSIALINDIPDEVGVFADFNMLQTIMRNLTSNAIKFTPKNGNVTISVSPAENKSVVITVKDTGIGMNPNLLENLFQMGENIRRQGTDGEPSTGLGLILCKEFIEKHGGKIWAESEVNKGSVFYFTLPAVSILKKDKNFSIDVQADEFHKKFAGLKILIVEDDNVSGNFIANIVNDIAKEIISVTTGTKAVELCLYNPDIDLVLMDIKLPELDGFEATRQIRQFNKEVVIIAQTAFAMMLNREMAIEAGCNDYITKPLKKSYLIEIINRYF